MTELKSDYTGLMPDTVLAAIDSLGYETTGRQLALNSYENRVYRCELEQGNAVVAKFYRPGRWSDDAILEEHQFARMLAEDEIPVVAPIHREGRTLFTFEGYRFALFPLRGGRWPDLESRQDRNWMGRYIARIHNAGRQHPFRFRPEINIKTMTADPAEFLQQQAFIPVHLEQAYETLVADCISAIHAAFERAGKYARIRLHGDCHRGNVLWTDEGPHFVDLDDCCTGPAIQDLWMLLSGDREEMTEQLCDVLEGYEAFAVFNSNELFIIEALRCMRMIHYAAWLARRWDDPAFPYAFPWFNTNQYWEQHILELREQFAKLQEPALIV
jgi:Ser/Thr protein kinase RdoA (MazF antagonist)